MNNMAVIHIKEGRLDDAERIFQGLIKDGYNVSAVEENLQKLQCLKSRNATQ
jgi:pentatricopeptide repeat protein